MNDNLTTSKLGKISLVLAVIIFVLVAVSVLLFFSFGSKLPGVLAGAILLTWLAAPLGHLLGLVLGLISLFRTSRWDWAGIAGIVLNLLLGGAGIGLLLLFGWLLSHTLGAFT